MQIKIWKNYILKQSSQILEWHLSCSKFFSGFSRKKCGKHLKTGKKDLSRVAKFVSHNGILRMNSSEILPLSLLNEHVLNINESFYKGLAVS